MHLESGSGRRCPKHPSRTFTGFCPVCLSERLTRVDKVERVVPKRCSYGVPGDDGGESLSPPGAEDGSVEKKKQKQKQPPPPAEAKVRKTLALLFRMNDDDGKECGLGADVTAPGPASSKHLGDFLCGGVGQPADDARDSAFSCEHEATSVQEDMCSAGHGSSLIAESRVDFDVKATSTSCSTTVGNSSSETCRASKTDSMRDDSTMSRGSSSSSASYWLGSALARTSARWGIAGVLRRCSSVHERGQRDSPCSKGEKQSETNSSTRRSSCDWNLCSGSRKNSCEDPRHSWDGSVMGRAFMCSLTCLDEKENVNPAAQRNSDVNEASCPTSGRGNGCVVDGVVVGNPGQTASPAAAAATSVEKEAKFSKGKPLKDMFVEERHHGLILGSISKRISNRWSKVWNWSISSPFRDLSTKQGGGLDRSLSDCWRERHPGKMESDNGSHMVGSSRVVASSSSRSTYFGSGDRQSSRVDWPRNSKRDYRFRRSQSVHYSSPGNLDNGLLRFYLTPLRSTSRNPTRGRAKTSRSCTRGIFGLS